MRNVCMLAVTIAMTACRGGTPAGPTLTGTTSATGAYVIRGYVSDSITRALDGASVTLVDGAQAGASTLTDAAGRFSIPFSSGDAVQVRFAKEGYLPLVTSVHPDVPGGSGGIAITLFLTTSPVSLAGTYTALFTADASCSQIPQAFRTRSYTATIGQQGEMPRNTRLDVTLSGATFAQGGSRMVLNTFFGFVKGDTVDLRIENVTAILGDWDEGISEQVAPGVFVSVFGTASLFTVRDPGNMTASVSGDFQYADSAGLKTCTASNHQLRLTRAS